MSTFTFLTSFLGFVLIPAAALSAPKPNSEAGSLAGRVKLAPNCKGATQAHVWIAQEGAVLHQARIPTDGSFEFVLKPGKFEVSVATDTGCLDDSTVAIHDGKTLTMDFKPSRSSRGLASLGKPAVCADCTQSGEAPKAGVPKQALWLADDGASSPWWVKFSQVSYPQSGGPGKWVSDAKGAGVDGNAYPFEGRVMMERPHVYIDGAAHAEVQVKAQNGAHVLGALPASEGAAIGSKATEVRWKSTASPDTKELKVGSAAYGALSYDYRSDDASFQDTRGFCADHDEALSQMKLILEKGGFAPREVAEFDAYWSASLPRSKELCVFPQSNGAQDQAAAIIVKPSPKLTLRTAFIVVTPEQFNEAGGKFAKRPVEPWKEHLAQRAPASADSPVVREWGVGFLTR